jgi:hypothetical protein
VRKNDAKISSAIDAAILTKGPVHINAPLKNHCMKPLLIYQNGSY